MANPTYDYFGSNPVSIVFKTSDNFNGSAFAGGTIATITPGVATFAVQAGGGLLNFHTRPLIIKNIIGGGVAAAVSIVYPDSTEKEIGNLSNTVDVLSGDFYLPVNAGLKLVSSGGPGNKQISVTAVEVGPSQTL